MVRIGSPSNDNIAAAQRIESVAGALIRSPVPYDVMPRNGAEWPSDSFRPERAR